MEGDGRLFPWIVLMLRDAAGGTHTYPLFINFFAPRPPMFQRLINDLKVTAATAARLTSLVALAGLALLVTAAFLCAAAFIYVQQTYGTIQACLAGAAMFFVVTLIAVAAYVAGRNQAKARAAAAAKSATGSLLADPMLMAAAMQVIRTVGIKRLVPILAVGGLALGLLASRRSSADDDDTPET
jgi:hypothetical protein